MILDFLKRLCDKCYTKRISLASPLYLVRYQPTIESLRASPLIFLGLLCPYISYTQNFDDFSDELVIEECVEFDGTPSVQEESKDLIFKWDFGDGSEPDYGAVVEHCYDSVGTFSASLSVIEPATKVIFAEEHNLVVEIEPNLILKVELKDSNSRKKSFVASLTGQLAYESAIHFWDFGDGEFDTGEEVDHAFETGEYEVRVLTKIVYQDNEYHMAKTLKVEVQ